MLRNLVGIATMITLLIGCAALPDIYLIDRHTVMEAEAAGSWPELEQRFRLLSVTPGPVNLESEQDSRRRERAFATLNGDLANTNAAASEVGR